MNGSRLRTAWRRTLAATAAAGLPGYVLALAALERPPSFRAVHGLAPRGGVDLVLAPMLIALAPPSALISILSGVRRPKGYTVVLSNSVALSMILASLCLVGLSFADRGRRRGPTAL